MHTQSITVLYTIDGRQYAYQGRHSGHRLPPNLHPNRIPPELDDLPDEKSTLCPPGYSINPNERNSRNVMTDPY